jgi:hypothetical protein
VLHNDDVVEVVSTKRQGRIDSVDTLIEGGKETQRRWRVHYTDTREPIMQYFLKEEDLRLVKCPHLG